MVYVILFVFGLAIGSFFNVVALRYDGEHFVFDAGMIGGRSHCPHCEKTLRWFELVPVLSYVAQGAACRHCKKRISFAYPLVEILTGLIFALVPWYIFSHFPGISLAYPMLTAALWVVAFSLLLLISYIDILLGIIPDELTIAFAIVAAALTFTASLAPFPMVSFIGPYAVLFGSIGSFWGSRAVGAVFGGCFFALLYALTKGRGMGMGDVKLAIPLGFLFGWPDIVLLCAFAFISGAVVGIAAVLDRRKNMKSALPFGPFLALGSVFVFFFGAAILGSYFRMLGVV